MNESDQLIESCQHLVDLSEALRERSKQARVDGLAAHIQLGTLDRRYRAAVAEAQRLQRRIPTGWLPARPIDRAH